MLPGMGNLDPKQLSKMMRQMGIESNELPAKRVVIELEGSKIVITDPEVVKITMQGKGSYQISGRETTEQAGPSAEDVQMVMESAGCTRERAEAALAANDGDIAQAIVELQEKKEG